MTIQSVSWRITGSDGYVRNFDTEKEARGNFAQIPTMRNIESELQRVTSVTEVIETRPMYCAGKV